MKNKFYKNYEQLKNNNKRSIIYYKNGKRIVKTFQQFYNDVEDCINKLGYLKSQYSIKKVGIIGPTSYEWLCLDYACIIGGFISVALPESYSQKMIDNIIEETNPDLILCDFKLADKFTYGNLPKYYFNTTTDHDYDFKKVKSLDSNRGNKNLIQEEYSIVFSSGTSEKVKTIIMKFHELPESTRVNSFLRKIILSVFLKLSFWSKKNNLLIIFLPFSHPMQRNFATIALGLKINILLSDPINCLKHIIIEKPNIMVSVPQVYEAIAAGIKMKINDFSAVKLFFYKVFNYLKINTFSNKNPIKAIFSKLLFSNLKKIYGERADFFVSGSAPINPDTLKLFYSVGVKIFEAYGQTEYPNVIMNRPWKFRIGSVGKPSKDVIIARDSEILIKYNEKTQIENKRILEIDKDGYMHTGDLGYIDKDGFLFILGRKDDVIVLSNGKKIHPSQYENKFSNENIIKQVIIFSFDSNDIVSVVCLKENSIKPELKYQKVNEIIIKHNKERPDYEQIKSFYIAEEPFSIENGMLTSTFKPKRAYIKEVYKDKEFVNVINI